MKLSKLTIAIIFCCTLVYQNATAQNRDSLYFFIDIPLFEHPFNTDSKYSTASMEQSINLTKSFYYATHYEIERFGRKHLGKNGDFWSKVIMSIFDFAPIPLSNTWLHEEFHRAVLTIHNIKSKNTHWTNSVKGVEDEDLVQLKSLYPADMVRAATAGNEGNLEYVFAMQKDGFFNKVNTWNYGLYWGNYLVNSFYLFGSTRPGSKPLVRFKNRENEDILKRDANGYDPINATYDLFNPDKSYTERGIHPSGTGIDRYVEFDDLTTEEQQFLRNQFALSFLNFIDLNLFGIELGKKIKFNFSLRHHMTPFGYMVGGNLLLKTEKVGGYFGPRFYRNKETTFLGFDMEIYNKWGMARLSGWQQPENQLFLDNQRKLGGLIQIKIAPPFKKITPYFDVTLKSKGWVAANPYLDSNISTRLGCRWNFSE